MSAVTRDNSATNSENTENPTGRIAIVTESTSCLPDELLHEYGISVVPIPFVFGTQTYLDGVDITRAQFYAKLRETRMPPKTSPPSPGEYLSYWREAAQHADAVVCVTVDSKISTLQRSARLAREMAPEALPGVPVVVVDSLSAGMGQGFVALAAARAARDGHPLEEVVKVAERASRRMRVLVTLDTLEYLAKTSRIPQVAAILGGVLAIKPIIQIADGDIQPLARVRTRRRSIEQLFERMRQMVPPGGRVHAAVQHAEAEDEAAALEARLRATFDCVELYTTEFTPVMGGYCGPGLLGMAFYVEDEDEGRDFDFTTEDTENTEGEREFTAEGMEKTEAVKGLRREDERASGSWGREQHEWRRPAIAIAPGGPAAAKSPYADANTATYLHSLNAAERVGSGRVEPVSGGMGKDAGRMGTRSGWGMDALVLAGAYLYGSLPLVYLLGRGRNVNLKRVGSGNVGATNLMAAGGPLWAAAGWVFDASKGLLPVLAARRLGRRTEVAELAGVCGVAGQCWPVFLGFQGGRGISAYVGATAAISLRAWPAALLPMIAGGLWRVAPRLARRGQSTPQKRQVRSKSMPLACFVSMITYPLARSLLCGEKRQSVVAPSLLSLVVLGRRLTASLPDDATDGPAVHPQALLYRLLYDRNTSV